MIWRKQVLYFPTVIERLVISKNVLQILHAYFMTTVYCSVIIYFQKKRQNYENREEKEKNPINSSEAAYTLSPKQWKKH